MDRAMQSNPNISAMNNPWALWSAVLSNTAEALRRDWPSFLPGCLCALFCVWIHGTAMLFFPIAYSLVLWAALASLGLAPRRMHDKSRFGWWFQRITFFWLSLLLLSFLLLLLPILPMAIALLFVEQGTITSEPYISLVSALYVLVGIMVLYRLWPQFAAPFLIGGVEAHNWPWHKSAIIWWQGPYWLGPSLIRVWRWTANKAVRRFVSPLSLSALVLLIVLSIWLPLVLRDHSSVIGFGLALLVAIVVAPLALVISQCAWIAILLAGETPLVVHPEHLKLEFAELTAIRDRHGKLRQFINRFPDGAEGYTTLLLPTEVVAERKDELLDALRSLGFPQTQHKGEYVELWDAMSDMKNENPSPLILDLQGAVLGILISDRRSKVFGNFRKLVQRWREEFSVYGDFY